MARAISWALVVILVGAIVFRLVAPQVTAQAVADAPVARAQTEGPTVVRLVGGDAERRGRFPIGADFATLVKGPPMERLTHRGDVEVDGRCWTIWLPEAKDYPLVNRGASDDELRNQSARLSIDADGDGRFEDVENWFANLPVRLGDTMFDVTAIAEDGSSLTLQRSKSPLRGIVVGRRVPPFELTTTSGAKVSDASLAGKPCVLDIWSVT